jgi:hypothetical protein
MDNLEIIPCVIEGGYNTSYINAMLSAFFYKDNLYLNKLLDSNPSKSSAFYLQELIKTNYIEPLRKHYSLKSNIINEIRNYLFINGYLSNENIITSMKSHSVNTLFTFLSEYLNGNKLEFDITKIKDGVIVEKDIIYKTSLIKLNVNTDTNQNNFTSIKSLFLKWLYDEVFFKQEEFYCYKLKDIPPYLCFYLDRNMNDMNDMNDMNVKKDNIMVDIMKNIKFFKNSDPTQAYIKYKIHSLICYDGTNYYSVLTTYNNKWIQLKENKIPSLEYILMSDYDITDKIKKEVVFVIYTLE